MIGITCYMIGMRIHSPEEFGKFIVDKSQLLVSDASLCNKNILFFGSALITSIWREEIITLFSSKQKGVVEAAENMSNKKP